jgi:hypothetical protein
MWLAFIGHGVAAVELEAGSAIMFPPSTITELDDGWQDLEVNVSFLLVGQ